MALNDSKKQEFTDIKFLSIIIPVYNLENDIEKCLKVLEPQLNKHQDVDLILIDDGSTDRSADIIENYLSKNIHLVKKENGGVSSARNLGLKNVDSRFVTFIDGDDYVSGDYIDTIKEKLRENDELLCFGYYNVNDGDVKSRLQLKDDTLILNKGDGVKKNLDLTFYNLFFTSVCNKIFRMDIIEKIMLSFNEKKHIGEDEFFCVEYYENIQSIRMISDQLYFYVQRNDSALHKYNSSKVSECESYIYCYQELANKYNVYINLHDLTAYYLRMWFGLIYNAAKAPTAMQGLTNVKEYLKFEFFRKNFRNIIFSKLTLKNKMYYILIKFHLSTLIYFICRIKNKF